MSYNDGDGYAWRYMVCPLTQALEGSVETVSQGLPSSFRAASWVTKAAWGRGLACCLMKPAQGGQGKSQPPAGRRGLRG
ncbi:hypothetical protein FHS42_003437 [Streptomyces zagrosensis]|uniref:Uncharacterized protein n=1 Tax=Streptomyces zagrosensis TaxID=1042984 RepID=A0A7W9UZ40_9ACTN|nr:hypothetical protein [Streptomyces zagrosensis]